MTAPEFTKWLRDYLDVIDENQLSKEQHIAVINSITNMLGKINEQPPRTNVIYSPNYTSTTTN